MIIPGQLRQLLNAALLEIHNENSFRQFTVFNDQSFQVDYDAETAGVFKDRVFDYLELLQRKNTIMEFIQKLFDQINPGQASLEELRSLKSSFDALLVRENDKWVISKSHFQCPMVMANLAFIDRDGVKEALYNMIGADGRPKMVIVDGKEASGLSYIRHFLNEVGSSTKCFELFPIDLKKHVKPYAGGGLVKPEHIAQYISDRLQMGYSTEGFKIIPFTTRLKVVLEERKLVVLFFFHQFNVLMAEEDVHEFMQAMLEMTVEDNANCYMVLSGYPQTANLPYEWIMMREPIDIGQGTFTHDHIVDFNCSFYNYLQKKKELNFTADDLLKKVEKELPSQYLAQENSTNVTIVGRFLSEWYNNYHS